jgi:O-acetyl-ADP-ribose deacetylase (regulator of RNase III)
LTSLEVLDTDITTLAVDAITNAANGQPRLTAS